MSSYQRHPDIERESLRVRINLYMQMNEQLLLQTINEYDTCITAAISYYDRSKHDIR
jgi:hypothetical protein